MLGDAEIVSSCTFPGDNRWSWVMSHDESCLVAMGMLWIFKIFPGRKHIGNPHIFQHVSTVAHNAEGHVCFPRHGRENDVPAQGVSVGRCWAGSSSHRSEHRHQKSRTLTSKKTYWKWKLFICWLVVSIYPSEKYERQLGWLFSIYGKI